MPHINEAGGKQYSKLDIAMKVSGAVQLIAKNNLQGAVYLLYDAVGLLSKQDTPEATEFRREIEKGVEAGHDNSRFHAFRPAGVTGAKAVIVERLTMATMRIESEEWADAAGLITEALEMVQRYSISKKQGALYMAATPDRETEMGIREGRRKAKVKQ